MACWLMVCGVSIGNHPEINGLLAAGLLRSRVKFETASLNRGVKVSWSRAISDEGFN